MKVFASVGIFLRFLGYFFILGCLKIAIEGVENNLAPDSEHRAPFMGWKINQTGDLAISSCCQENSSISCADFIDDFLVQHWQEHFGVIFEGIPEGRKNSRKVDFFIIILDKYRRRWVKKIVADVKMSFFWEVSRTKILVVAFSSNEEDHVRIVKIFSEENIPKMALLLPNTSFLTHNKFTSKLNLLPPEATIEDVFPDKMANLNGFEFRLSQYGIFPRSMVIDDHVYGFDGHLLDTLVGFFNSTYRIMAPGFSPDIFFRTIDDVLTDKADFNFNLRILFERSYQEASLSWLYPLRVSLLREKINEQ